MTQQTTKKETEGILDILECQYKYNKIMSDHIIIGSILAVVISVLVSTGLSMMSTRVDNALFDRIEELERNVDQDQDAIWDLQDWGLDVYINSSRI